jgi:hypothetical protein
VERQLAYSSRQRSADGRPAHQGRLLNPLSLVSARGNSLILPCISLLSSADLLSLLVVVVCPGERLLKLLFQVAVVQGQKTGSTETENRSATLIAEVNLEFFACCSYSVFLWTVVATCSSGLEIICYMLKYLLQALGEERRAEILGALSLAKNDVSSVVRQSALLVRLAKQLILDSSSVCLWFLASFYAFIDTVFFNFGTQVWKTAVDNTPKTLREIMPQLMEQVRAFALPLSESPSLPLPVSLVLFSELYLKSIVRRGGVTHVPLLAGDYQPGQHELRPQANCRQDSWRAGEEAGRSHFGGFDSDSRGTLQ